MCLDAAGVFCETYCPPADDCKLTCDPNAMVLATADDPAGADRQVRAGLHLRLELRATELRSGLRPGLPRASSASTGTDPGLKGDASGLCCKLPSTCEPQPPLPAPCAVECDQACLAGLNSTDPQAGRDQCCRENCGVPPCAQKCDRSAWPCSSQTGCPSRTSSPSAA